MSRIRSIHPGFFTDEAFVQVSAYARLLLLGVGVEADDQGTFAWKPITLKMRLFPVDAIDVQELLRELLDADAIRRYFDEQGREFGAIRNFCDHQRPKSPKYSNFLPDELRNYVGLNSSEWGNDDSSSQGVSPKSGKASAGEGRGGESRGEEGKGEESRGGKGAGKGTKLPKQFEPVLSDGIKELVSAWPNGMFLREVEKFKDHHTAKGSVMRDWQAALRTWLRNADEWSLKNGKNGNRTNTGSGNGLLDAALDEHGR